MKEVKEFLETYAISIMAIVTTVLIFLLASLNQAGAI